MAFEYTEGKVRGKRLYQHNQIQLALDTSFF